MEILSENEIWRLVYILGGDDYTIHPGGTIYVLKDGKCITEIDVKVIKMEEQCQKDAS